MVLFGQTDWRRANHNGGMTELWRYITTLEDLHLP